MPLLPSALTLMAGVLLGLTGWWPVVACVSAIGSAVLFFLHRNRWALALLFCSLGTINSHFRIPVQAPDFISDQPALYSGLITRTRIGNSSQTLTVHINRCGTDSTNISDISPFDATVTVPAFDTEYEPMQTICFRAALSPVNPVHDLPDELTSADIQLKQRIFMHCVIPPDSVKSVTPASGIKASLKRFQSESTRLLLCSNLKPRTKEFLCTALLGDPSAINPEVRSDFASAGLAHILALSGLHVGLIVMLVSLALWPLRMVHGQIVATIITISLLWLYAAFTGMGDSVVRAVVMLSVYLGAGIFQRRNSGINSLCFAAIAILLVDPSALFSIGFQLSFAAVAAILVFANSINPVSQRHRLAYSIASLLSVSISAMIGTALISCYYFHTLPVYFLIANISTALILPWLIGGGAVLTLLLWLGCDPPWLCHILDLLYSATETIALWVASLPGSTVGQIYRPAWLLLPYAGVLAMLKLWLETRRKLWGSLLLLSIVITGACFVIPADKNLSDTLYIARTTYHTNLIADIPDTNPIIITTAPRADLGAALHNANMRYANFLGMRGYDSLRVASESITAGNLRWKRPWLQLPRLSILVISSDTLLHHAEGHAQYAILCRGYRKSIHQLTERVVCDTIVLSYDLHPKRLARYRAECDSLGLPYRNMRSDGPWSIPISSRKPR